MLPLQGGKGSLAFLYRVLLVDADILHPAFLLPLQAVLAAAGLHDQGIARVQFTDPFAIESFNPFVVIELAAFKGFVVAVIRAP